jgi:hypothetical protein
LRYGQAARAVNLSPTRQETSGISDLCIKRGGLPLYLAPRRVLLLVCFFTVLLPCSLAFAAPQLSANLDVAAEGYFVLSWDAPDISSELTLQESREPDFSGDLEQWPVSQANQFTQSGLTNGLYFYRLADGTSTSNVVKVEVQHHSLSRAWFFFSLGAVLFILLVGILLHGRRQHPQT